jgi:hypothetical protein
VRQGRDLREELRQNRLARDKQLDGLEPDFEPGIDEVLALSGEQAELLALPPRSELADELELRVRS